jgi:hypothetical protein
VLQHSNCLLFVDPGRYGMGRERQQDVALIILCCYLALITCVQACAAMTLWVPGRWLRTADFYYLFLGKRTSVTRQQAFKQVHSVLIVTLLALPGPALLPRTLRGAAVQWAGPGHLLALLHTCSTSSNAAADQRPLDVNEASEQLCKAWLSLESTVPSTAAAP